MSHIIEPASSGRAKCRGCKKPIGKGELRFGERLPNPFAEGEMTLWFHVLCAAYRRPEPFLEVLDANRDKLADPAALATLLDIGIKHPRITRITGADLAPSARARCRSCKQAMAKDSWRIVLEFFEEGMFNPSGYVHAACAGEYFGTTEILDRVKHFSPDLEPEAWTSIEQSLG